MKLDWQKWGYDFWQSVGRHVGTAGGTWLFFYLKKGGAVDWHDLWGALLTGAIMPTVFTFLQTSPAPAIIKETSTTTVTPQTITQSHETITTRAPVEPVLPAGPGGPVTPV